MRAVALAPGCQSPHVVYVNEQGTQEAKTWGWNRSVELPTCTPSYLVYPNESAGYPRCHSFIRDGRIEFLSDCTHALAGRTVDLPDIVR